MVWPKLSITIGIAVGLLILLLEIILWRLISKSDIDCVEGFFSKITSRRVEDEDISRNIGSVCVHLPILYSISILLSFLIPIGLILVLTAKSQSLAPQYGWTLVVAGIFFGPITIIMLSICSELNNKIKQRTPK